VGLKGRLRNLEREAETDLVTIRQADGTVKRFASEDWTECFLHEYHRGLRHFEGEEAGPAHPLVEALKNAAEGEVERLVPTQGTMLLHWLGEDEILRGKRERPGPPVRETSPGVYE
jgi:hypothetical protein